MLAVTGATGFVGHALCEALTVAKRPFRPIGRQAGPGRMGVGEIGPDTDWRAALDGVTTVVHLAARVHQMQDGPQGAEAAYRRVNVDGTLALARQAVETGVTRLVFVSSVKVNGERTAPGRPFAASDRPDPQDAYGRSKAAAEEALRRFGAAEGLEVVIVRPPLVYGPGVGANFRALVDLSRRGLPLPLASIRNKRSLIAVQNLADLLIRCAEHPHAPGRAFLCSDGEDVSTPDLFAALCRAAGLPARLFAVPPVLLHAAAAMVGRSTAARRLTESLQVEIDETRRILDWSPALTMAEALAIAARSGWHRA